MTLEPELYTCYHCKEDSLKITVYSYSIFEQLIYRTDGYCVNHPVSKDVVFWCRHCEKFLIVNKIEFSRQLSKQEKEDRTVHYTSIFTLEKKYMHGSKKYEEEWEKNKAIIENRKKENKKEHEFFHSLYSVNDFMFAIKSDELREEPDILYKLMIQYWHDKNSYGSRHLDNDQKRDQDFVYGKLMEAWEDKTDERYLFKAELLRNTGDFEKSDLLLTNPEPQYKAVMEKHPSWVYIIKTLNSLKLNQSVEIRF